MKPTDPVGPILLDTHVWVWYFEGAREKFARRIESVIEAAANRGEVFISSISVWEIALLEAHRRLELSQDVRAWVARALALPGVRLKGLSPAVAIESTRLPGSLHRDPADRILVSTARQTGASIVTNDRRILAYAKQGHVRVIDARR